MFSGQKYVYHTQVATLSFWLISLLKIQWPALGLFLSFTELNYALVLRVIIQKRPKTMPVL